MRDSLTLLVLLVVAFVWRMTWWSGIGLMDDGTFLIAIERTMQGTLGHAFAYRILWWLPTALSCRLAGGITETAVIAPILAASLGGIAVVYAWGRVVWGWAGGCLAAVLLLVHPIDVAWSTMLANDVISSFWGGFGLWCMFVAVRMASGVVRRVAFCVAALSWACMYYAKVSGALLVVPLAWLCWTHRKTIWPDIVAFLAVAALLFGAGAAVSIAMTGSPLGPYHIEQWVNGFLSAETARFRAVTRHEFLLYPKMLFLPFNLGDMLYSIYPHLAVVGLVVGCITGMRVPSVLWVWFWAFFLPMELQITYVDGVWATVFRNIRHSHVFIYPIVLIVAGYLVATGRRFPKATGLAVVALVGWTAMVSVSVATKTQPAFADERFAVSVLRTLPSKPIYGDVQMLPHLMLGEKPPGEFRQMSLEAAQYREQVKTLTNAYLITGGGREPYYGCHSCFPMAGQLPPGRYRLIAEGPPVPHPTPWRKEPIRVWETTM